MIMLVYLGIALFFFSLLPHIIYLVGTSLEKPPDPREPPGDLPPITLILSAYNEEQILPARVRNLMESTYPKEKVEIILIDDFSGDQTARVAAESLGGSGFRHRVIRNPERLGTNRSYNRAIPMASHPIIVTTDADVFFEPDALVRVVTRLVSDDDIVAVCGDLRPFPSGTSTTAFESVYRNFFGRMCEWESRIDSTYTFNGALVAFRKDRVNRIEDKKGSDDANTAFEAIRRGYRAVYEIRAVVYEYIPPDFSAQYRQKTRRAKRLIEATLANLDLLGHDRPFSRYFYPLRIFMYVVSPALFFAALFLFGAGVLLLSPALFLILVAVFALVTVAWRRNFAVALVLNQFYLLVGLLRLPTETRIWESTTKRITG
ncbi:MAG TPA: glycosyltransferase [Methanomicrobiales archaeon]|nr:glycosyltransferase [Methanomicrobiales archaeon]